MNHYDVIIIGAGAAGLMCALTAGQRGRRVLLLDHANRVGKKILMSGGGRCNFTNMYSTPENFLSRNPHFAKSALSRYTPWDFIALVEKHGVPYHEKTLGQLFCDRKAKDIVELLLEECRAGEVRVRTHCSVRDVQPGAPFRLQTSDGDVSADSLVVASGGLSIPRMGATGFGYDLARRFGINVLPTRAGLVPFTLGEDDLGRYADLTGVSVEAVAEAGDAAFRENILFTHRGLSGPAVLQASSYWQPGDTVSFDLYPEQDLRELIESARRARPKLTLGNLLAERLTKRVARRWCELWLQNLPLDQLGDADITRAVEACQHWTVRPAGTEGYRTAEVTLGGVDTDALSSQTMECRHVPGLYFIGEVVDVTGHLGGHNFQWAWASGRAAGAYA
ncbi:MAG: NAD(P)/FAD-dependent oxidoreductase [Aquisalimonadaceae bacterium]